MCAGGVILSVPMAGEWCHISEVERVKRTPTPHPQQECTELCHAGLIQELRMRVYILADVC